MKVQRIAPVPIALAAIVLTLAATTPTTQAAPNSGVVTVCDDAHLASALSGGGLVTFSCGPATITATLKAISANTTIDGGGNITLTTSSGVQQLFSISSGIGLTLTNLTIANVPGASYAFPLVNNGRLVLTATSVISTYYFINSTASSSVNIANSTFISNTGTSLNASGSFTITNSQFLQNMPGGSGMFVTYNGITGTIDNSDFISNSTNTASILYSNGGAFAITNSRFQENTGSSALIGAYGLVSLDNSDFISNTTLAVYSTRPLVVSNSRFYWNRAGGYASVIYLYGYGYSPALTLTNSSLMGNTAPGGAIYNYYGGTAYISNTQFVSNTSTNSAGALYLDYPGTVQVLSSTFQLGTGGGIYVNGSANPLIIADSSFVSNTSVSTGGVNAGTITVTHSSFIGNRSTGTNAGALDASRQAYITDSTFINNLGGYGGGMDLAYGGVGCPSGCYDVVANTIIKGNVSTANGGGLYFNGYVLTATNILFQNNVVTGTGGLGGGVYFNGTGGVISNSTILSNSAGSGGGVYQNSGPLQIVNAIVQSNTAQTNYGGGLESHDAMTLPDVNVIGNRNVGTGGQGFGGGLYLANYNSALHVSRSLFYNNVASQANSQGGGLYLITPALITNTTIYSNSAGNGGSGLNYNNSYAITLTNDTIMSNTNASGVITSQLNNTGTAYRVTLVNTLIGGGAGGNCAGNKVLSLGHNLSSDASCAIMTTGDLSNTNPLLGAFQNNGGATYSFMPSANSPAVNAGDNNLCPSDDQRSVARPIGAACDIGSIESPHLTPQTITFNALPDHFVNDAPFIITATTSSGLSVSFNASGVCGVNGITVTLSGVVGSCTITATQSGNATYAPTADVARTFNVTQVTQTITFNPLADHFVSDPPFVITATASSGLAVSFNASGVCAVNGITVTLSGVVGSCTITATQSGDAIYAAATPVARSFNVQQVAQAITFNPLADHFVNDAPFVITATASSGLAVSFNSSGVCAVNGITVTLSGVVGSCIITATQSGNATYAPAAPVAHSFNVSTAALLTQTITFNTIPDPLLSDPAFVVAPTASSGLSVTITSLTPSVCSVTSNLVTLLAAGTCTLRASQAGNGTYAAAPNVDRSFTVKPVYKLYLPLVLR